MTPRISLPSALVVSLATIFSSVAFAAERTIRVEKIIPASIDDVWNCWTTSEGAASFAPSKANIELRVGGPFEWYFAPDAPEGSRGSEGCKVLSFVPKKMLSFTWNAPPKIPNLRNSGARTNVVVLFDELAPNRVKVTISQIISEEGPDWDTYYEYFNNAWQRVLTALYEKYAPKSSEPAPKPTLDVFAPFIGEWKTEGVWEDPKTGSMRIVYEWALDKKAVVVKSYVDRDGTEQMVYTTTCSLHPQTGEITFRSDSVWDVLYQGIAEAKADGTLEYTWFDYAKEETRAWRQTITLNGDKYDWKVFKKGDTGWTIAKESTFKKTASATTEEKSASAK